MVSVFFFLSPVGLVVLSFSSFFGGATALSLAARLGRIALGLGRKLLQGVVGLLVDLSLLLEVNGGLGWDEVKSSLSFLSQYGLPLPES